VDPAVGSSWTCRTPWSSTPLNRWASEAQKAEWFPKLASDTVGAYALSEAGSGSDAFALACRAEKDGDDYVLNGHKLWITNGNEAELFLVFATVDPEAGYRGITAFLVPKDTPGFSVGKKEDKLGIRASSTTEILFENCRVPASAVMGEVGKGYKIAIETLNEGRIGIGAQMVGLAQGALDHTLRYVKEREQFGRPIGEFQGVQFQLAEMATEDRGGPPPGLQRGPPEGRRPGLRPRGGPGQALFLTDRPGGGLHRHRPPRRLRLHPGVPGGEALPGCQDRDDLRGNDEHAAPDDREAPPALTLPGSRSGPHASAPGCGPSPRSLPCSVASAFPSSSSSSWRSSSSSGPSESPSDRPRARRGDPELQGGAEGAGPARGWKG
jgi:hypothetical protein